MKKLLSLLFIGTCTTLMSMPALAQNADDYFHGGAQSFINSDLQAAITQVEQGLLSYPDDPRLNALMEKLKEEQEKQQQQQQQNQDQQQQEQEQNQEQDQEQNQDNQQQNQNQDQQEQDDQQSEGQESEQSNGEQKEGQPSDMQQMSKEDAEKILKALAQKEKELLKEFKKKKTDGSAKHDKDW